MSPSPEEIETVRAAVARAARELAAEGLVLGTAGNLSARVDELVAVTPTGGRLAELEPGQVTVVAPDGTVVAGELAPTSELDLHLGVYDRHGAGAVVHTHAPMATALGCVLDELPVVHYGMLALGGAVPVVPYRTFGSSELAEATVAALEGHLAALMANHGAITWGHDLPAAVENARLLEWVCTVFWRAAAIGTPRTLTEDDLQAVLAQVAERGYGSTRERER